MNKELMKKMKANTTVFGELPEEMQNAFRDSTLSFNDCQIRTEHGWVCKIQDAFSNSATYRLVEDYEEPEEEGDITATRFKYRKEDESLPRNDTKRYGPWLEDNVIRTDCGRLSE